VVEATPAAATRWPPQVEAAAYFCCQEALDNAARHARGAPASVRLDVRSGWLEFSVTDMGPGFDPAGVDGTGLQHMTDRVEALAGTLQVLSTPALGTRVVGRIPLQTTTEAVTTSPGSLPPR
jgi:signal transduction histidine kinase